MKLHADPECHLFKDEHPDEWATFGCGPGGTGDYLVPDTMWGLDISEACRVHDWYYRFFSDRSPAAKKLADNLMLENTLHIVNTQSSNFFVKALRRVRCHTYYSMVNVFGKSSWEEAKSIRDKK
jgi:hypothetical protein